MTGNGSKKLRDRQLAFLAQSLAGVSHEFKNHLAVINELRGLLSDLLNVEFSAAGDKLARFTKILASIEERIGTASLRASHLNRFAHRMDEPLSSFNVNELLEEELSLLNWMIRQKKVKLATEYDQGLAAVVSNPSLVQLLVFLLLVSCLEQLAEGGSIKVVTAQEGSAVKVELRPEGAIRQDAAGPGQALSDFMQLALAELQGEMTSTATDHGLQASSLLIPSLNRD